MSEYRRIIAVDFDGTLAETKFPEIVAPKLRMIQFAKQLQQQGVIAYVIAMLLYFATVFILKHFNVI